jgi:mono/diheme cytochrome c family protein
VRPRLLLVLLVLAAGCVAAILAGCGQDEGGGDGRIAATEGAVIFREAGCGACHRLAGAGASGLQGPDLDAARPSAAEVEDQVRAGGRSMPSFEERMSDEQVSAVARYVEQLARGG